MTMLSKRDESERNVAIDARDSERVRMIVRSGIRDLSDDSAMSECALSPSSIADNDVTIGAGGVNRDERLLRSFCLSGPTLEASLVPGAISNSSKT